jgi:hypothetical protein
MAFLKENKVSVMDWLGNSPDLNPIENLWSILKAKLKKKPPVDLAAPADPGRKAIVDHPAQEPDGEARPLHAQQDQALH